MPELDAKMRTAASTSRRSTNGINHHFFSRAQNLKNSLNTFHINAAMSLSFAMFATQWRVKKEAEVKNLCLSDSYLNYRHLPYCNLKNICGAAVTLFV